MIIKRCSKCKLYKWDFWPDNRANDWLRSDCKECRKIDYDNNRDILLERKREYYWENPEIMRKRSSDYFKTEIWAENSRLNWAKRRALKRTTEDWSITIDSTTEMLDNQWWVCNYCWIDIMDRRERHLDHIYPLSKWWTHTLDNVQWLCCSCNMEKWDKIESGATKAVSTISGQAKIWAEELLAE